LKLTNAEVFLSREPLRKLMDEKLPVKVAYGLAKAAHKLNEQLQVLEEVRNGLIRKYGVENKEGKISVEQGNPNWDAFVTDFDELLSQETELVIERVKLPETLMIETNVLAPLEKIVYV